LLLALAATLACSTWASVYVISDTFSLSEAGWSDSITLDRFASITRYPGDSHPLVRVDVVFQTTVTADLAIGNPNSEPVTVTVVFGPDVGLDPTLMPGQNMLVAPRYTASVEVPGAVNGTAGVAPILDVSASASSFYTSATADDLTFYDQVGAITSTVAPTTLVFGDWFVFTGWEGEGKLPPTGEVFNAEITGTIWIVYHAPEPSALALLGLGLLAAVGRRPRRRRP
jgi:hypothetical protein